MHLRSFISFNFFLNPVFTMPLFILLLSKRQMITSLRRHRNPLHTHTQFFEKLKKTMCSLRCLFVLSQSGEIMISKRFPTVEKRARLQESSLTPIPSDVEFSEAVRFSRVKNDVVSIPSQTYQNSSKNSCCHRLQQSSITRRRIFQYYLYRYLRHVFYVL